MLIDVLANDLDEKGEIDATTVQAVTSGPSHGGTSVEPRDGRRDLYARRRGVWRSDSFTYTVEDLDGARLECIATVTVSIDLGHARGLDRQSAPTEAAAIPGHQV